MLEFQFLELKHSSERAYLVVFDPDISMDPLWIPKSQCDLNEETRCVYIKRWLAKEKGLVDE